MKREYTVWYNRPGASYQTTIAATTGKEAAQIVEGLTEEEHRRNLRTYYEGVEICDIDEPEGETDSWEPYEEKE